MEDLELQVKNLESAWWVSSIGGELPAEPLGSGPCLTLCLRCAPRMPSTAGPASLAGLAPGGRMPPFAWKALPTIALDVFE